MNDETTEDRVRKLYSERVPHDSHTTNELIEEALKADDVNDHAYWEPVTVLWHRGSADVLEAARKLCLSESSAERQLGANILSQLGAKPESFHEERLEALLRLLDEEDDMDVLATAFLALGHLCDSRTIPALVQ